MAITAVLLIFGLPVLAIVAMFLLVPMLILNCYQAAVRGPVDRLDRKSCAFALMHIVVVVLASPAIATIALWVLIIRIVKFVLCAPVGLICGCSSSESRAAARDFGGRPGVVDSNGQGRSPIDGLARQFGGPFPTGDVVVCMMGGLHRQGFIDTYLAVTLMFYFMPVYKLVVMANPWLYDLKELYTNQWSAPIDANADQRIDSRDALAIRRLLRDQICRPKLKEMNRRLTDTWPFHGFYPYPPAERTSRTHVGLQFSDGTPMLSLFTHTAHPSDLADPELRNIPGHTPRSEHANFTISSVYLQRWNPFHHLTGYVEVNVRNDGGVEHPMWLLVDVEGSKLHTSNIVGMNKLFVRLGVRFANYTRHQPEFANGRVQSGGGTQSSAA